MHPHSGYEPLWDLKMNLKAATNGDDNNDRMNAVRTILTKYEKPDNTDMIDSEVPGLNVALMSQSASIA